MLSSNSRPAILLVMTITFMTIYVGTATGSDHEFSLEPYITITTENGEPAHDMPKIRSHR